MDDVYEQAAEVLRDAMRNPWPKDLRDHVRAIAGAVWTAQYGCPQCHGTGKVKGWRCTCKHVQLVNPHTKEQVQCDPAKTEWRCDDRGHFYRGKTNTEVARHLCGEHPHCGWVPVPEGSSDEV